MPICLVFFKAVRPDYVFDGTSPPYGPSAQTNPLQFYGKSKRDGEVAVLGVDGAQSTVLRVPVLYVLSKYLRCEDRGSDYP